MSLHRALWVLLITVLPSAATVQPQPEDLMKSAVVVSFLRYTRWPGGESAPIRVGVIGRREFAVALRRLLEGKSDGKRPYRLHELHSREEGRSCHLVYVAAGKDAEMRSALAALVHTGPLIMGEDHRFLDFGGDVNLLLVDGRVGFEFRRSIATAARFTISSRLLRFGQARGCKGAF